MPANLNPEDYQVTTWGNQYHELECPSGQKCLAQRLGMQQLIRENLDPDDLDMLTNLVNDQHVSKKSRTNGKAPGKKPKTVEQQAMEILRDPDQLKRTMDIMDKILVAVVVAPKIHLVPDDPADREENLVYADMVAEDDKAFISNWALGGSRDLERFRTELGQVVDSMADVENLESAAE